MRSMIKQMEVISPSNSSSHEDAEGLRSEYDVILVGTGLVQSIVAAAVARTKRTVLHVDEADYYGGLEAVWTLPYILHRYRNDNDQINNDETTTKRKTNSIALLSSLLNNEVATQKNESTTTGIKLTNEREYVRMDAMEQTTTFPIEANSLVHTPYGKGIVERITGSRKLRIALSTWTLANGQHPILYVVMETPVCADKKENDDDTLNTSLSIDTTQLLFETRFIETVVALASRQILQCHSRSLALDMTPYVLFSAGPAVQGLLTSGVADYLEFKSIEGLYYRDDGGDSNHQKFSPVPCSKNDVFASPLLSPMDKRRLMKFLQTALDFATAEALQEESSTNEVHNSTTVESWNELHLNQGRALSRPQNKAVANADLRVLQDIIEQQSTMTFEEYLLDVQKLSPSLTKLVRYALALEITSGDDGHNSTTTENGIRQLCAHMMSLGQFGTTAFLTPMYGSGELPQAFCRSAAVYGATYLLRRSATGILITQNNVVQGVELSNDDGTTKRISSAHVVVSDCCVEMIAPSEQRVIRRIGVIAGKPLGPQQHRHVIIIPPHSYPNQTTAVHCILMDETAQVAPIIVPNGCTVLHITTTVHESVTVDASNELLATVASSILCQQPSREAANTEAVREVFYTNFSINVKKDFSKNQQSVVTTKGLHVVRHPRPGLTADDCFEQAKVIFDAICPGHSFLKVSEAMKDMIREALGEEALNKEEDEEERILENAAGMLKSKGDSSDDEPNPESSKE